MADIRDTIAIKDGDIVVGPKMTFVNDEERRAYHQHRTIDLMRELVKHDFDRLAMVDALTSVGYKVELV